MGCGAMGAGGGEDFYMLCEEPQWNLPFKAEGYYDLNRHEPVPGGELERNRALRSGTLFITGGVVLASELTEEEYQALQARCSAQREFDDLPF